MICAISTLVPESDPRSARLETGHRARRKLFHQRAKATVKKIFRDMRIGDSGNVIVNNFFFFSSHIID